jgi:hypothetical protein
VEGLHHLAALRRLAGEHEVGPAAFLQLGLENLEHLDELREDEHLVAGGVERLEQLEKRAVLPEPRPFLPPASEGWQQIWRRRVSAASTCMRDCPACIVERRERLAAALQFGEIKLALALGELAIDPLLDAVGQILRDLLFQAAQHDGPHAAGEQRARRLATRRGRTARGISCGPAGSRDGRIP